jgi:hypothetical protein
MKGYKENSKNKRTPHYNRCGISESADRNAGILRAYRIAMENYLITGNDEDYDKYKRMQAIVIKKGICVLKVKHGPYKGVK